MTLTVISGECALELNNQTVHLRDSESYEIRPHVEHRIVAVSDVRAIVSFDAR